jgi:hypothetical protein
MSSIFTLSQGMLPFLFLHFEFLSEKLIYLFAPLMGKPDFVRKIWINNWPKCRKIIQPKKEITIAIFIAIRFNQTGFTFD